MAFCKLDCNQIKTASELGPRYKYLLQELFLRYINVLKKNQIPQRAQFTPPRLYDDTVAPPSDRLRRPRDCVHDRQGARIPLLRGAHAARRAQQGAHGPPGARRLRPHHGLQLRPRWGRTRGPAHDLRRRPRVGPPLLRRLGCGVLRGRPRLRSVYSSRSPRRPACHLDARVGQRRSAPYRPRGPFKRTERLRAVRFF